RMAPLPLYDLTLSADGIGGAVQDERGGGAAGELAVDVDVFAGEHVADAHHAAVRQRDLVDASLDRSMAVCVDDARKDELAGGFDDLCAGGDGHRRVRPCGGDLGAANEHRPVLDPAVRDSED